MSRAKTNKFYRTFSKGLITEAGYLTYPEDSSSDELNTILSRKGNRSRRLGIDYEDGFVFDPVAARDDRMVREFVWQSVNNDPNKAFLVVQVGAGVFFYELTDGAISEGRAPFSVDLTARKIPSASYDDVAKEYCDFSAGSGFLFIAHRFVEPLSVEWFPEDNHIDAIPLVIQVRDFEGVYDGLANDDEPSTLSPQHHYNLLNQGWVTPGTRSVDISSPDAGGSDVAGGSGTPYYDPYTGVTTPVEDRGGSGGGGDIAL